MQASNLLAHILKFKSRAEFKVRGSRSELTWAGPNVFAESSKIGMHPRLMEAIVTSDIQSFTRLVAEDEEILDQRITSSSCLHLLNLP